MPLMAKAAKTVERPTGSFPAVCVDAIDMGWHEPGKLSKDKSYIQKCKLRFYYVAEGVDGAENGFYADFFATLTIGKKSSLGKFIEEWFGIEFTAQQREDGYDVEKLIGQPCTINVVPGNAGYVDVASAGKLSGKMRLLAPEIPKEYVRDKDMAEPAHLKYPEPTEAPKGAMPELSAPVATKKPPAADPELKIDDVKKALDLDEEDDLPF